MRIEQNPGGTVADNPYDVAECIDRYMVVVQLHHLLMINFARSPSCPVKLGIRINCWAKLIMSGDKLSASFITFDFILNLTFRILVDRSHLATPVRKTIL